MKMSPSKQFFIQTARDAGISKKLISDSMEIPENTLDELFIFKPYVRTDQSIRDIYKTACELATDVHLPNLYAALFPDLPENIISYQSQLKNLSWKLLEYMEGYLTKYPKIQVIVESPSPNFEQQPHHGMIALSEPIPTKKLLMTAS